MHALAEPVPKRLPGSQPAAAQIKILIFASGTSQYRSGFMKYFVSLHAGCC